MLILVLVSSETLLQLKCRWLWLSVAGLYLARDSNNFGPFKRFLTTLGLLGSFRPFSLAFGTFWAFWTFWVFFHFESKRLWWASFGVFWAFWPFWAYRAFWVILITLDLIGPLRLFGLLGTLSEILDLFATLQDILGLFGLFWPLVILGLWVNWIILSLILGFLRPFWCFAILSH